jgi:hypothetical protein
LDRNWTELLRGDKSKPCREPAGANPERATIDKALATGESFRNITKRFSISPAALFRHKKHIAGAMAKAQMRREERIGDGIFEELRRVLDKAWELLEKFEAEGDTRGAVVALREVRASLESIEAMQSRVDDVKRARIVVNIIRDGETPVIQVPGRPALDDPAREVEPDQQSKESPKLHFEEPYSEAQRRENYLRALRDVSRAVEPAPVPPWAR